MSVVPRPQGDEFAPHAAGYISTVEGDLDAVQGLGSQRNRVSTLLAPVSEERAGFRYAPGKWSIREVIGHVGDTERVFAYRLLRVARGDETPLSGFDEGAWARAAGHDRRSLRDLLDEWIAVRSTTIALVNGIEPAVWRRRVVANGHPVSGAALLYMIVGHVEHHCRILEREYRLAPSAQG